MPIDWLFVTPFVCGIGIIIAALGLRYRPHVGWNMLMIACGIALMISGSLSLRYQWKHDHRIAHIKSEEASVQKRLDALKAEMQRDPNPTDPNVVKSRRELLDELQQELNSITKEFGALKG